MSFIQILLFRQVKKENDILVNNPSDSSLSLVPDPEKVTEDSAPVKHNVKKNKKSMIASPREFMKYHWGWTL